MTTRRQRRGAGGGIGAVLVLALGTASGASEVETYVVDPARTTVSIHVGRAGILGFAGHEHLVIAPKVEGRIRADPAHDLRVTGTLTVQESAGP